MAIAVLWAVAFVAYFALAGAAFSKAARAAANLPKATLLVAGLMVRALFRRRLGEVAQSPFAHGPLGDAPAGGRRALDVLATSLAPDGFVLRTPAGRDEIVTHRTSAGERKPA